MNKTEFINHISAQYQCTKTKAEKVIDRFTSSIIEAMEREKEISLSIGNLLSF